MANEPPVGAFWSVTMYDATTKLLVENSIDRWKISSANDLQKNQDGSFVMYLQPESIEGVQESNWLPTPDGEFYIVLRLYLPEQHLIDGDWNLPTIEQN